MSLGSVTPNLDAKRGGLRFRSILVVTYGRSGSTLLQGLLNALPNVLVRGENHDFCWGLFLAWKSLIKSKATFGTEKSCVVSDPWYGAAVLNPDGFLIQARDLLRSQLGVNDMPVTFCWGFKEIRYIEHLDELHDYLDFLSRLLPDVGIVFNTRVHDAVCTSAFWKKHDPAVLSKLLQRADRLFLEYAEKHEHAFVVRYERLILGMYGLAPLFAFLGVQPSQAEVDAVLRQPHSYAPKLATLNAAARCNKQVSTLSAEVMEPEGLPCRLDLRSATVSPQGAVLVACVVKDERARLPWFLHYYRSLGCQEFLFIDNGSSDGTIDYLLEQPDVTLYHAPSDLYNASRSGRDWINILALRHAMRRWLLLADADELLAWPGCEREGLDGLVARAVRMGLNRVFTPMIDVYSNQPCESMRPYEPGRPFADWSEWMDPIRYLKLFWDANRLIVYSGPRMRFKPAGKRPPIMSKQKLYFVEPGGYENYGSHFDSFGRPSPLVAPFLHYKFFHDFKARVHKAIEEGQHWNNAEEYRDNAAAALFLQSMMLEDSVLVRGGDDLREYIAALGNTIRSAEGLCGSGHWKRWQRPESARTRSSSLKNK